MARLPDARLPDGTGALVALYAYKDLRGWALESLRAAGYDVRRVHRVYLPKDPLDGEDTEVLYEEDGNVYTAWIEPTGHVLASSSGWH